MAIKTEYTYQASLLRVVDADTFDLIVDLGFGIANKVRVRLRGVDAPEIHGVKHGTPEHKAGVVAAKAAETWLSRADGDLVIRTHKEKGKFGRWLADIENSDGASLAKALVSNGFARVAGDDGKAIERRDA